MPVMSALCHLSAALRSCSRAIPCLVRAAMMPGGARAVEPVKPRPFGTVGRDAQDLDRDQRLPAPARRHPGVPAQHGAAPGPRAARRLRLHLEARPRGRRGDRRLRRRAALHRRPRPHDDAAADPARHPAGRRAAAGARLHLGVVRRGGPARPDGARAAPGGRASGWWPPPTATRPAGPSCPPPGSCCAGSARARTRSPISASTPAPGSPPRSPRRRPPAWCNCRPASTRRPSTPARAATEVRARLGLTDRPVVVCVSRLVPRKGQDTLILAMPRDPGAGAGRGAADRRRRAVREGPAQARRARPGSPDSVRFTGPVPWAELPAHYGAGDVFAMPCRTRRGGLDVEGLGIVYLEASATGLPVVAGRLRRRARRGARRRDRLGGARRLPAGVRRPDRHAARRPGAAPPDGRAGPGVGRGEVALGPAGGEAQDLAAEYGEGARAVDGRGPLLRTQQPLRRGRSPRSRPRSPSPPRSA